MIETIKSYLVDLGFSVDKSSYEKTKKTVGELEKGLGKFTSNTVKGMTKAGAAMAAFGVTAAAATAKFLNGLGDQNIQMQILSRQLWTTEKQANAFSLTLKAMGTNLKDLYLSPTLMQQYRQLHSAASQMGTPGNYQHEMQQIQGVQLQLRQMRLEAYYALQWIGYYFVKYFSGPMTKIHSALKSVNHMIVKGMPVWTKRVAAVMYSFVTAGEEIARAIKKIYDKVKSFANNLPKWAKKAAAAIAIISLAMNTTPFGKFMMALGAALLLLQDFLTYLKDPKKAALTPLWNELMKIKGALKEVGKAVASFTVAWVIYKGILKATTIMWGIYEAAIIAATEAQGAYLAVQSAANALMAVFDVEVDSNLAVIIIAAIVAAIAGLVIGIIELIKHWKAVKRAAGDALNWIKKHVMDILPFLGPAGWVAMGIIELVKHFGQLEKIGVAVWHMIKNEAVKAINGMITQINKLIRFIDHIPGISIPQLNKLKVAVQGTVASAPYAYGASSSSVSNSTTIHANQTNNIYGSNANAIGASVANGYNRHLYNIRGAIG
ncbi:hypothetical protein [Alicyclobacillus sp. SO9]|uniref:hypothetical protein n=1 Tax=Alicyclobacillus sp. SO9 TaxID=2665646 RepID=UPI0018E7C101|nr:hypothetical protein [Alicyclobacillus sp. SO9]QQE81602.1 hypothetical protein GI364_24730 [Alicyclobacillus sp. SO9]